jgi:hypothetical protein
MAQIRQWAGPTKSMGSISGKGKKCYFTLYRSDLFWSLPSHAHRGLFAGRENSKGLKHNTHLYSKPIKNSGAIPPFPYVLEAW